MLVQRAIKLCCRHRESSNLLLSNEKETKEMFIQKLFYPPTAEIRPGWVESEISSCWGEKKVHSATFSEESRKQIELSFGFNIKLLYSCHSRFSRRAISYLRYNTITFYVPNLHMMIIDDIRLFWEFLPKQTYIDCDDESSPPSTHTTTTTLLYWLCQGDFKIDCISW